MCFSGSTVMNASPQPSFPVTGQQVLQTLFLTLNSSRFQLTAGLRARNRATHDRSAASGTRRSMPS
jgi:hypothetical protein